MDFTATCELSSDKIARKMSNRFISDGMGSPANLAERVSLESLYFDDFISASCTSMIDLLGQWHHSVRIVVNQNSTVPHEALADMAAKVYREVYRSDDFYTSAPVPTVAVVSNRRER